MLFNKLLSSTYFVNTVLDSEPSSFDALFEILPPDPPDLSSCAILDYRTLLSCSALKHEALTDMPTDLVQYIAMCLVKFPNEANLRRLSELCAAVECNILELFCDDTLNAVSSCCKEICSSSIESKTTIETMLAQDILAQLAIALQTPQTPSKSSLETPPGARVAEPCRKRILQLFSECNASTTLKITILRLAMFCSEKSGFPPFIALEGLKLARRIITPIELIVRKRWAAKNSKLLEKLILRLSTEALDLKIRLQASTMMKISGLDLDL